MIKDNYFKIQMFPERIEGKVVLHFKPSPNRARKSRGILQNKVRINVVPVQLLTFPLICLHVYGIQKIYSSIVFYYTVRIIAQKYMLFHIF